MTATVAKTFRIPRALYQLILDEAERGRTSEAEIVRTAIRKYFEQTQEEARLDQMEKRIQASLILNLKTIEGLVRQIIAMAQPGK